MARMISGIMIIATFVIWTIWDVYAFTNKESNDTLSVVITDFAYYSPGFCVLIGGLIGHWFFPARGSKDK